VIKQEEYNISGRYIFYFLLKNMPNPSALERENKGGKEESYK